jgi:hypothetical protein
MPTSMSVRCTASGVRSSWDASAANRRCASYPTAMRSIIASIVRPSTASSSRPGPGRSR